MEITEILNKIVTTIGNAIPSFTDGLIKRIEETGWVANNLSARLISILIILALAWAGLHLASGLKTWILWLIKILAGLLIISVAISTFMQS